MKIKRTVAVLSAVMLAAGLLAGCTSGNNGKSGSSDHSLTLYTYDDAPQAKVLQSTLKDFTKKSGISVKVNDLPGSGAAIYPGKLRTALAGGKGPDVWRI
jgi:raffinose/stachyose/melibiose transport system substrate-binding protein